MHYGCFAGLLFCWEYICLFSWSEYIQAVQSAKPVKWRKWLKFGWKAVCLSHLERKGFFGQAKLLSPVARNEHWNISVAGSSHSPQLDQVCHDVSWSPVLRERVILKAQFVPKTAASPGVCYSLLTLVFLCFLLQEWFVVLCACAELTITWPLPNSKTRSFL